MTPFSFRRQLVMRRARTPHLSDIPTTVLNAGGLGVREV